MPSYQEYLDEFIAIKLQLGVKSFIEQVCVPA